MTEIKKPKGIVIKIVFINCMYSLVNVKDGMNCPCLIMLPKLSVNSFIF